MFTLRRPTEAALSFLQKQALQAILCVGDIVDGRGSVDDCCGFLQEHQVITVRGNHDKWFLDNQLRDLPEATPAGTITPLSREYIAHLPGL